MNSVQHPLYLRITAGLIITAIIITVLVTGRELFIPFTLSMFFTFLLLPISMKLEHYGVPKPIAIIISIIAAVIVFAGLLYFFYIQVTGFANDWPQLQKQIAEKTQRLNLFIEDHLHMNKAEQKQWLSGRIDDGAASAGKVVMGLFSATGTFLAGMALIPIYIFFLTCYRNKFKTFIRLISPAQQAEHILQVAAKTAEVSQKYLKGLIADILILSVLNSTGFLLLGLQHAILFGVLAAILNVIPYVGVLIGSVLPVMMALLTKSAVGYAFGAAGICIVVQFIDNNFITPYVVGSSVSINPLTAIIALITGALIWGIAGMILSLPLTGMIKVICDNVDELKPYGFLIGGEQTYGGPPKELKAFRLPGRRNTQK